MSEKQIEALITRLKEDAGFKDKLKDLDNLNAADQKWKVSEHVDAAVAIAHEAGLVFSREDLLSYCSTTVELSDEELETSVGGAPCSMDGDVMKTWLILLSIRGHCR